MVIRYSPPDGIHKPPRFFIKTWGCQMNALDSDRMAGILLSRGYLQAESEHDSDVVLLNTCSVREGAAHKVFSELGTLRSLKSERELVVGVVGCVAQQEGEAIFQKAPFVDLVMGPRGIPFLPDLLEQARKQKTLDTVFHDDSAVFSEQALHRSHPAKAYVTVMEGCNKKCAFCIVPYTRGREVYRPLPAILDEARQALDKGYLEIELLGQNVNCWTRDGRRFENLLDAVSLLPGLRRLRFTTSHPRHFPLAAADLMAEREVLCPYIHLPVQAGSDRILKLMRRQYNRGWYLELVAAIRERVPGVAFSSDVIVGFPSESEEEFQETLDMVRRVEFDALFSFRYSPRPGTPAEAMEGVVPEETARMRHQRLLQEQAPIQARRFAALVGRVEEVLVEGPSAMGGEWAGRTPCNKVVNFGAPSPPRAGSLVRVRVTEAHANSLRGTLQPIER